MPERKLHFATYSVVSLHKEKVTDVGKVGKKPTLKKQKG